MDFLSPPPPPPPPPPSSMFHVALHTPGNSFPVIAIALIGILATAFILVSYYIFVIKCCLTWHQIDFTNRFSPRRRNDPTNPSTNSSSDDGPKGLEEGLIRSIPIIKFRKQKEQDRTTSDRQKCTGDDHKATDCTYECAVCLSEFEDGEKLRVIPNCCHAFHIDCIDIWLQNNANCPLCRTGISVSTIANSNTNKNWIYPPRNNDDNFEGNDDDYVVIEIEGNNLDEPRVVSTSTSTSNQMEEQAQALSEVTRSKGGERKELGHVCSMGDELLAMRNKGEEFGDIQPMRRSISMDLSSHRELCLEMQGINLKQCREIIVGNNNVEGDSSTSSGSSSSKVRRSIFSFGYGRRGSVQPVHLDL